MRVRELLPPTLFILAYCAILFSVIWMHARFGSLLSDAVLGVPYFFFSALMFLPAPVIAGAIAVSLSGVSSRNRAALGAGFITITLLMLYALRLVGGPWALTALVLGNVVPSIAFIGVALRFAGSVGPLLRQG